MRADDVYAILNKKIKEGGGGGGLTQEQADERYQRKGDYITAEDAEKVYAKKTELPKIDNTLSKSGQAADAEAVGNEIEELRSNLPQGNLDLPSMVGQYFALRRTGKVYQSKEWKCAVNPTQVIEKLGINANIPYKPSTDTVENEDGYADLPEFFWAYGNYIRKDNEDYELTAIEGMSNYSETGSADVCAFGPMFYYNREDMGDYYLWSYSDKPNDELGLKPFQTNADGTIPTYWLLSAFASSIGEDGLLHSQPGRRPERLQSYNNMYTNYQKKGKGYFGARKERRTFQLIFNAIKGGTKNSQSLFAGVTNWNIQYDAAVERSDKATYFPVTAAQAANLQVGLYVSVGYGSNNSGALSKDRGVSTMHACANDVKILRIEDMGGGNKAVYLDIEEGFDTTPKTLTEDLQSPIIMSSMHAWTGETKKVIGKHDGSPASNTDYKHPYRIQGVEYAVGGYFVPSDIVMVIKSDMSKDVYTRPKGVAWTSAEATVKNTYTLVGNVPGNSGTDFWIGDVDIYPETGTWHPATIAESSAQGMGDRCYAGGTATSGTRESLEGGNLWGGGAAGAACLNCWNGLGAAYWYYLSCD